MNQQIEDIVISKLSDRELTPGEEALFAAWYSGPGNRERYRALMRVHAGAVAAGAARADVHAAWEKVRPRRDPARRKRTIGYWAAATVAMALLGAGFSLFGSLREEKFAAGMQHIQPASRKAVLTLSSGEGVAVSDIGSAIAEDGARIANDRDGRLVYDAAETAEEGAVAYNTITIPRGGYYRVVLSDGTVACLNAQTELRYPATFRKGPRVVELHGEGYFVVARDNDRPFIVRTGDYDVRVTGTQFNVRSYRDGATSTTLVEGAVQIEQERQVYRLLPGQQAVCSKGEVSVAQVDVEDHTAWYNGVFSFPLTRLEDIMDELSRWYDMDVVFAEPALKDMRFSASFNRDSAIGQIVELLQKTQRITLSVENRTFVVKGK